MDAIEVLGSTLGLGFLAGIRLYATVLLIGLVVRFHWIALPPTYAHFQVLGDTWVLTIAAIACAMEFLADKIPWVDSFWDSIHTFIRPVGAFLLGATAMGSADPVTRTVIALLCGGIAFTGHSSKAATRLLVNHVPEPFTNIGLSLAGDVFLPFGFWVMIKHPAIALGAMGVFIIMFVWFAPLIFRSLRVELLAIGYLFTKYLTPQPPAQSTACVRCSAGRGVKGLINSVGNLCQESDDFVFSTRRMFRRRVHRVPFNQIARVNLYRGLLVDTLTLSANDHEQVFDVFKIHQTQQPAWLGSLAKARAGSRATSSL